MRSRSTTGTNIYQRPAAGQYWAGHLNLNMNIANLEDMWAFDHQARFLWQQKSGGWPILSDQFPKLSEPTKCSSFTSRTTLVKIVTRLEEENNS